MTLFTRNSSSLLKLAFLIFELFASTGFSSIYILNQSGNKEIVNQVNSWDNEFLPDLEKMWGVYPQKPIYMVITNANLGLEMGNAADYPTFFQVTITMRYPISEIKGTVAHELMHVFQFSWMDKYGKQMPLWVMEGLATWYGGKMGFYPSSLNYNPFLFKSVNPLEYKDYPINTEDLEEYYAEVYALFLEMAKKIDFEKSLPKILENVEITSNWKTAFSESLGESFDLFYSKWRSSTFYYLFFYLIVLWGIWIFVPIFLLYIFLKNFFHPRKENDDDIKRLEDIYGKSYWSNEEKGETDEKSDGDSRTK